MMIWLAVDATAIEPDPDQQSYLSRAVFADGRLWLLTDAGELSSITEDGDRIEEPLAEPAQELCLLNGKPAVATCNRENCGSWTFRQLTDEKWNVTAKIETKGETLTAIDCSDAAVTFLTPRRIINVIGEKQNSIKLSKPVGLGSIASVHGTTTSLFVGLNAGEWGGGLVRIDRKHGTVRNIERTTSKDLCAGPLNSNCDPVTGIVPIPWKPDCIAVAIGMVHFASHGRIVEVCGNKVKRIYFKAFASRMFANGVKEKDADRDEELFSTVAFFGIASHGNSLLAVGINGVYEIDAKGTALVTPLPTFKDIGGIHVSFDLPNLILVLTNINRRHSISGSVPMLVPR
jgi:hypothetical protein